MPSALPPNWEPDAWQPPNWQMPVHTAPPAFVPTRAAFLDRFGRFAKSDEEVAEIRLWAEGAAANDFQSMTVTEFYALTLDERYEIRNLGSGAGLVVTEGISNA